MAVLEAPAGPSSAGGMAGLAEAMITNLDELMTADWEGLSGQAALDLANQMEQVVRRVEAVQARVVVKVEADGLWALDGARTLPIWLRQQLGSAAGTTSRLVRESRALRDYLPATAQALGAGRLGGDHVRVLAREATATARLREQLADPDLGEGFLVAQAEHLDATRFAKVVKSWAIASDPDGADRAWRESGAQEELTVAPTLGGYHVAGWLNEKTGRVVRAALDAHMGRRGEGDERTPSQRRAAALVTLAHQCLDAGSQQASARVRPHVSVTVPWATLAALSQATGSAIPPHAFDPGETCVGHDEHDSAGGPLFPNPRAPLALSAEHTLQAPGGPRGHDGSSAGPGAGDGPQVGQGYVDAWRAGDDHVISSAIDHRKLIGTEPATFSDGTPLAPAMLARLACESQLARVVFGPESTVLDAGREKRIFPASQARAIIARDRHCQYPGCDEPSEFGEIHHSLWWAEHQGSTSVEQGILLCWHHHDLVHQREITITRHNGHWYFSTRHGLGIAAPRHAA